MGVASPCGSIFSSELALALGHHTGVFTGVVSEARS